MKIKNLSILIIVVVISMVLTTQVLSFVNFKYWGNKQIDVLFGNIVTDIQESISQILDTAEKIAFNISVNDTVQDNFFVYNEKKRVKGIQEMDNIIDMYTINTNNIGYVGIIAENEVLCYSLLSNKISSEIYNIVEEIITERKSTKTDSYVGHYQFGDMVYFTYITDIFPLDVSINKRDNCYVLVLVEFDDLLFGEKKLVASRGLEVTLTDVEDRVLTSSNNSLPRGEKYVLTNRGNTVNRTLNLDEISCKLNVSIPAYEILNVGQPASILIILVVLLAISLFVFLMLTLVRIIVKSILEIDEGAKIICSGNYEYRIEDKYKNEISNIVSAMNKTLDAVEEGNRAKLIAQEKFFEAELLQKQAEITSMQNQISPHFLYNSMEYINNIAQKHNIQDIIAITNIMAETFRYNTYGSKIATVGEDIDYAFNYFNIINLRRAVPIGIQYDVPEDILKLPILKMTFQPIIENVIKHAFKDGKMGELSISGHCYGVYSMVEFKDNGQGIEEDRLLAINQRLSRTETVDDDNSVGIFNVNRRLKNYFNDEECGIQVTSIYGAGTVVTVKIRNNQ